QTVSSKGIEIGGAKPGETYTISVTPITDSGDKGDASSTQVTVPNDEDNEESDDSSNNDSDNQDNNNEDNNEDNQNQDQNKNDEQSNDEDSGNDQDNDE